MESQFRILGPIEVELEGGRGAPLPGGRVLSFLALLLVRSGAIVRLDRVVDELWEGAGPRNARNAVQVVASRLRAAVGHGVVVSARRRICPASAAGSARRRPLRRTPATRTRRAHEGQAAGGGGDAARGARALAWPGARGRPRRGLRPAGDRAARGPAPRLPRRSCRCRPRMRPARRGGGRARGARSSAPAARATAEPAHARPLSLRAPGGCAGGVSQCAPGARGRAGNRAVTSAAGVGDSDPAPGCARTGSALGPSAARASVGPDTSPPGNLPLLTACPSGRSLRIWIRSHFASVVEGYHATARAVCARHGGTMVELRGDAVLAVFGMPVAHEDDAQRALRAAAELGARTEHCRSASVGAPASAPAMWSRLREDAVLRR